MNEQTSPVRCAIYARFSSEMQDRQTIVAQVRKCREFAERRGWVIQEDHIYCDEQVSGYSTANRPQFQRMVEAAMQRPKVFDYILVDDTSRFSRRVAEEMKITDYLAFHGTYIYFVGQGIDTQDEDSFIPQVTNSLVDQIFVKNLGRKMRDTLVDRFLNRFWTGGRVYGYRSIVGMHEGKKRSVPEVNPEEAEIVVWIFEQFAIGLGLKAIAAALNRKGVNPPHSNRKRHAEAWGHTTVRNILRNRRYVGDWFHGVTTWKRNPVTAKRKPFKAPNEWLRTRFDEGLAIVSRELFDKVRARLEEMKRRYKVGPRGKGVTHFLSNIGQCSDCGGPIRVTHYVTKHRIPVYGCARRFSKGANVCRNTMVVRVPDADRQFLEALRRSVMTREAIAYAVRRFHDEVKDTLRAMEVGREEGQLKERLEEVTKQAGHIADAIAQGGGFSPTLKAKLVGLEEQQRNLEVELSAVRQARNAIIPALTHDKIKEILLPLDKPLLEDPKEGHEILKRYVAGLTWEPILDGSGAGYRLKGTTDLMQLAGEVKLTRQPPEERGEGGSPRGNSGGWI